MAVLLQIVLCRLPGFAFLPAAAPQAVASARTACGAAAGEGVEFGAALIQQATMAASCGLLKGLAR